MKYSDIFFRVRRKLNDFRAPLRWSDEALRMYAGTILRRMAEVAPFTCAAVREVELVAGATQAVPSWAVRFLGCVNSSARKSIRNVSPEVMDAVLPGWRADALAVEVLDCIYDKNTPGQFSVYPPAAAGARITIRASVLIPDPATNNDAIPVHPVNEVALIHGILAMCFSEDTDAGDLEISAQHFGQFYKTLGIQRSVDAENPPAAKEDGG